MRELIDARGRQVRALAAPASSFRLDVTALPPGIYLLRIAGATQRLAVVR